MKYLTRVLTSLSVCFALSGLAQAQSATPIFDKMANKDFGERGSLDRSKTCLLALKVYDDGVKELGLDKSDSKQAVRADKALPFVTYGLKTKTQTSLLFDRAVADVVNEFAVFKAADAKAQKKFFRIAKLANKKCAKPYDNRKLEGYGSLTRSAEYLNTVGSDEAKGCMGVAVSGLSGDRMAVANGVLQFMVWGDVYKNALRAEGHPEDELIETMGVKEAQAHVKTLDGAVALDLYETCPAKFKKAKFQAGLKQDEPAEIPVIDWN